MSERRWAGPFGEKEFEEEVRAPFKSKTDTEVLEIMGGERIWWCEKHNVSASGPTAPCKEAHVVAYRTGGNPWEPNRCKVAQRWLVKE